MACTVFVCVQDVRTQSQHLPDAMLYICANSAFSFKLPISKQVIKSEHKDGGFCRFWQLHKAYAVFHIHPLPGLPTPTITPAFLHFGYLKQRHCYFLLGKLRSFVEIRSLSVKDCSHGLIASAIYFSQLMGCMGFSVVVAITPCEHLH